MSAKDDQSGMPAEWVPKVGARVFVPGNVDKVTTEAGITFVYVDTGADGPDGLRLFGSKVPRPDPVPLLREALRASFSDPAQHEAFREKVRAAYPEAFQ